MSKDYAKIPPKHRSASRGKASTAKARAAAWRRVPGWLWLLTVAAVCGFVYGLYLIKLQQNPPAMASGQLPAGAMPTTPRKILPPPPARQWTFHEILRDKTVAVPETGEKPAATEPAAPPKAFLLSCGVFATPDKAQTLKARLAFAGLRAEVKPVVNQAGQTRYRVSLGPYASKRAAQSDQHAAVRAKIPDCRVF